MIAALLIALAVETATLTALVHEESRGVVDAVSARGAVGLCQIVPRYSRWSATELRNPWLNLIACVEVKSYWQRHCGPRWLAGYRQGWKGCRK